MSGKELKDNTISAVQWSSAILPILNEGHSLKIPLSGLSMHPLLVGERDEAVISSVQGRKLKKGDIVLYVREDGTHVLHRIHHINRNGYYMLGDAQTWIEGPVKREKVLAVAVAVIRKGKAIQCDRFFYRVISAVWLLVRPLRPLILRLARPLRALILHLARPLRALILHLAGKVTGFWRAKRRQ